MRVVVCTRARVARDVCVYYDTIYDLQSAFMSHDSSSISSKDDQQQLTTIMIALSMIPNPTNGTALMTATRRSCLKLGSRTVYSIPSSAAFSLPPLPRSICENRRQNSGGGGG